MTLFMMILMIVFAMGAIIIFAWSLREERADGEFRAVRERRSPNSAEEDSSPSATGGGDPTSSPSSARTASLANTDLPGFMTGLRRAPWWKRIFITREEVGLTQQGRKKVEADTALIAAHAGQVKTFLGEKIEIDRLKQAEKLLPLDEEKERARVAADIEEQKLRAVKARVEAKNLRNPPPPPPVPEPLPPPKEKSLVKQAEEELEAHLKRGVARHAAVEKVRAKYSKKHAGNEELMEDLEDLIAQWQEAESME